MFLEIKGNKVNDYFPNHLKTYFKITFLQNRMQYKKFKASFSIFVTE